MYNLGMTNIKTELDKYSNSTSDEAIIINELEEFLYSKERRDCIDGDKYFDGRQDILRKQRIGIGENGEPIVIENLPNSRIVDNQYQKIVKQKYNYILGKRLTVKSENETYQKYLDQFFDNSFHRRLKNVSKDSLNMGVGWLYAYYDKKGELMFKRYPNYELRPIWNDAEHTELEGMIRIYTVRNPQTEVVVNHVEYYNKEGIKYYIYDGGTLVLENANSYFKVGEEEYNWGKVPFIAFKYNSSEVPLINNIKSLQDGLNNIISNFADNIQEDPRNTILVLTNYDGTDLGEFRRNLATYGAVKVRSGDGASGGVSTLTIPVNADNYNSIINVFKTAIVENGMGYDAKSDIGSGTPNEMNIKSMYSDIDLDAKDMISEFKASLEELLWFINHYLKINNKGDYSNEVVEFTFNKDIMVNESTVITDAKNSVGIISDETILARHPWVTDVKREQDLMKEPTEYEGAFKGDE